MGNQPNDYTHYCTDVPTPVRVRAEVTADNTSIRVSWQWRILNMSICVDLIRVYYLLYHLGEALIRWAIQQLQPVPSCPTADVIQSTLFGLMPVVVQLVKRVAL